MAGSDKPVDGHSTPHQKVNTNRIKVTSSFLGLFGAIVIGIQIYVYVTFDVYYDEVKSSRTTWFVVYNAVCIASGCVSFLIGVICLCCISLKPSSSGLRFGVFGNVLAAIVAVASTVLASIEADSLHADVVCQARTDINCSLWFDFEVAVAALSGLSFIISLATMIVISVALRTLNRVKKAKAQSNEQRTPPVIVVEPVEPLEQVEQVEPTPAEVVEPVEIVAVVEEPEEISYIEQLKMLSKEELERRLLEHRQQQFLQELRNELERRSLLQESSKEEEESSVQPKPDYDETKIEHIL